MPGVEVRIRDRVALDPVECDQPCVSLTADDLADYL